MTMDPDAVPAVGRVPHGSSEDPDVVDFSANINPRVPAGVESVYRGAIDAARRYPPEPPAAYRAAAADSVDGSPAAVIPTPGGLAAIRLAIECTVESSESVLVPYPSFGEYAREVQLQGAESTYVRHDELLDSDPAGHALAIVCNPNNPTGDAYDDRALRDFADRCRDAGTPLVVDEAFLGFTERPSLAGRDGVVVARSLTKLFGLPGLRAGFAVASGELRDALLAARPPWNLGVPALHVGAYCLRQGRFIAETRERVRTERRRLTDALSERFSVHPSEAPFLLLDVPGDVDSVVARALDRGVAIRDARTFRGLDSHVRVAVRDPEENDRLLEALDV